MYSQLYVHLQSKGQILIHMTYLHDDTHWEDIQQPSAMLKATELFIIVKVS